MSIFNPIAPPRAYQLVMDQLEEAIVSGKFRSGEKLPPERELIEVFGTSRRTLREAFRVLEQKGLLDIKVGAKGGTFVADHVQAKLGENLALLVRKESVSSQDLAEFRTDIESTVAALSARRAPKSAIKALHPKLKSIAALLESEIFAPQLFVDQELALHQMVADMCGNALYGTIVKTIHHVLLYREFLEEPIDPDYVRQAIEDWRRILEAIENRKPEVAKRLMAAHILEFDRLTEMRAKA